ncbi:ferric siderophore receptor [Pseudomonas sp. Lz4W]|uniref:TonB-dependent siderophore receptor n=1 Tax=Pseudomonas sp. Lz4W TaxID=1206777 RepID=UPI0002BD8CC8|nr:TonB-dependent siderophore receptor [Pseudomonas sp. Lz4W]AUB75346.1 ferric siderophore receptor [Pseudomonas sp. Lz4W]
MENVVSFRATPSAAAAPLNVRLNTGVLVLALCTHGFNSSANAQEPLQLDAVNVTGEALEETDGPVTGYIATHSTAGTKTLSAIHETPQSISVVTRDLIDAQQPASVSQALRYTAGANSEKYGGFGDQLDLTRIRGVDADYYLDGLRMISNVSTWSPQIDPYALERIEVLRGPAAAVYGQGTGGGVINQVSRRPQPQEAHEINLQYGSFAHKEVSFDSTGPLNDSGTLLYRLTGVGLASHGQVEDVRHERYMIAPAITWQPTGQTRWTVLAQHQQEPEIPDYNSLPAVALGLNHSPFARLNVRRNYTDMHFQDSSRKQDSVSSLFEHSLDANWSLHSNARYQYVNSDITRTSIYGYKTIDGRLWLEGTYGLAPSSSNTFSMDNYFTGTQEIGNTRHLLLAGVDYQSGTLRSQSYRMTPVLFDPNAATHYRPSARPDFTDSKTHNPYSVDQQFDRLGYYLQDQISYEQWRLMVSLRHDKSQLHDRSQAYTPAMTKSSQTDQKWSYRIGFSYLFDNGLAPYISYATSFDPVLGADYAGAAFVPVTAKQYEAGLKFQSEDARTTLTASVYELTQDNVKTADSEHLGFYTQAGSVRSRGFEIEANSAFTERLNGLFSYAYLDNRITQDTRYEGRSLTQTPRHTAATWLDYDLPLPALAGLNLGGGLRYVGSTYGNPTNSFKVPAVTLVDLALRYDLGQMQSTFKGAQLALNVSNLANKHYVASCSSELYCFIGLDRTITSTLSYRW